MTTPLESPSRANSSPNASSPGRLLQRILAELGRPAALGLALGGAAMALPACGDKPEDDGWGLGDDTGGDSGEVSGIDRVCETVPLLADLSEGDDVPGLLEVCLGAEDEEGGEDCPVVDNHQLSAAVRDHLGPHPDGNCSWWAEHECGPEASITDDCCYVVEILEECVVPGRPLRVDGHARVAPVARRGDWCAPLGGSELIEGLGDAGVARWTEAAQAEHASVASFARLVLQLLALGAPPELVARATAAMQDEIGHAADAFGVVRMLGGGERGPGPLPVAGAMSAQPTLAEVLLETLVEGAINETLAASEAAEAQVGCELPAVTTVLQRVAREEGEHAALGWAILQWGLSKEPELGPVLDAAFADARARALRARGAEPPGLSLASVGLLDAERQARVTRQTWERVLLPAWKALREPAISARERARDAIAPA